MNWWDPLHGDGYQFWSGIGSGSPILLGAWVYLRKHNCHVRWCFRVGRHPVDGTTYVVCRKHHPLKNPKHYLPTPDELPAAEELADE